jgi:ferredoxin--NADP+ reductase
VKVGIVGAGPAGVYAADSLLKHDGFDVDVLDRLPTPYGLVRYGVAPDHLKIKSIEATLRSVLESPAVRFLGNVSVGVDLTVPELRAVYDAVIYACGAAADRRLEIPGEDLPGSISASTLVAWYCGHPDVVPDLTLPGQSVVVLGVGNVAVDVARILGRRSSDLEHTDVPAHVLDVLADSPVTDIHVVGRRGAAQAKFTTKELRELGELEGVDVVVRPDELELDPAGQQRYDADATVRRNLDVLRSWAQRPATTHRRRIHLRFGLRPVEVVGTDRVTAVAFERTRSSGEPAGPSTERIDAQLVVRAIGYRGVPIPGLPFDAVNGVVPSEAGRVVRDGEPSPGEYVAGWIKRGPTGVIGTNRSDAAETVRSLVGDVDAGRVVAAASPDVLDVLRRRGHTVVQWPGWLSIDDAERALGARYGRPRVKLHDRDELLAASVAGSTVG